MEKLQRILYSMVFFFTIEGLSLFIRLTKNAIDLYFHYYFTINPLDLFHYKQKSYYG